MAIIQGLRGPAAVQPRMRALHTRSGVFAPPLRDTPAAAAAAPLLPASLDGLLALQERETDAAADRGARRHGEQLLSGLDTLQRALLSPEGIDPGDLARLAGLAASAPTAASPALRATLAAISLRARIELARRGV